MFSERLGAKSVEKILLTAAVLTVFTGFTSAFAGGSGTQTDPYEITTCVQLQEIQNGTTGTLSDHYELVSDIDCSETENWNNGNGFKPIGTDSTPFTGSVDGKGNRIQNLYINRQNLDYVGLFGFLDSATGLKNFTVLKSDVTGNRVAGGVIGYKSGGKASNLTFKGNVTGSNQVGGLVGSNFGGNITDSKASVNVSGDSFVGGLVGRNIANIISSKATGSINGVDDKVGGLTGYSLGEIRNSTSKATVSATRRVGGLVGKLDGGTVYRSHTESEVSADNGRAGVLVGENSGGAIDLSYSKGSVSANDYTGGLVGDNKGPISNSYAEASVSGRDFVGGLIGRNKQASISSAYSISGVTGSTDIGAVIGRNEGGTATNAYWDTELSTAPSGIGADDNAQSVTALTTSEMQGLSASENMDFDWANDWRVRENDYPVPVQINGFSGGSGTQTDPYRIETCEQLQDMNQDLDAYYELVSDIDCSATENWNNGKGFDPVGPTFDSNFSGSLDGGGHDILRLSMDREGEAGLFGVKQFKKVSDLNLVDVNVSSTERTGALVGFLFKSDVLRVNSSGVVSTEGSNTGGLVGIMKNGYINDSHSDVDVSAVSERLGGLVSQLNSDSSYIYRSYATGDVEQTSTSAARSMAGGLVGNNKGNIIESFATGDVSGKESELGGLVGLNNFGDIRKSYSTGSVEGGTQVGGLIGSAFGGSVRNSFSYGNVLGSSDVGGSMGENDATLSNVYWDSEASQESTGIGRSQNSETVNSLVTSEMQGSSAETNMNLDFQSTWETVTGSGSLSSPGYPILRDLNRSRQIKAQGIARFEGGSGTPEDPYEIATCQQLQDMNQNLTASYELVSDIDCSETTGWNSGKGFEPVGSDFTNRFEGKFYGKNKTISNLYISRGGEQYVGLFGAISSVSSILNTTIINASVTGDREVGILAGENGGFMSRLFVSGDSAGRFNHAGLVGRNDGEIKLSIASVEVTGGNDRTAALVGQNTGNGEIYNAYVSGDVSGNERVAGLVGYNDGLITESYSVAKISGSVDVGGVIGENSRSGSSSDIYWDTSTSNQATGIGND